MIELEEFTPCWDWLNISCNNSNCSLLNGLKLDGVGLSSMVTWCPQLSLSFWWCDGFQSVGFPWIFQHVSLVWPNFRRWSHQGLPFLGQLLLKGLGRSRAAKAEPLETGWSVCDRNINFFLVSSWHTSKSTSRMLGKGLVPNIMPQTSSRFFFNPNKNL